ncbi:hypothetical protein BMS3Abin17_00819 [archaeon BMS3Abin17]|nr:hypothetical protein BMS3Abin17_00819 [archaeon BMS3Abin17]HDZ60087.1 hypothetical protein [Candidatus Pacearchaeota archaeon]
MGKELKNLLKIAKKITKKEVYKKLKSINDEKELEHALKYSLISSLHIQCHKLEKEIEDLEKKSGDVFFARNKSLLMPSKIKHFQVSFDIKEFNKLHDLIKDIKKEIKNVQSTKNI